MTIVQIINQTDDKICGPVTKTAGSQLQTTFDTTYWTQNALENNKFSFNIVNDAGQALYIGVNSSGSVELVAMDGENEFQTVFNVLDHKIQQDSTGFFLGVMDGVVSVSNATNARPLEIQQ